MIMNAFMYDDDGIIAAASHGGPQPAGPLTWREGTDHHQLCLQSVENTVWSVLVSIIDKNLAAPEHKPHPSSFSSEKEKRERERRGIGQAKIIMGWPSLTVREAHIYGPLTLE